MERTGQSLLGNKPGSGEVMCVLLHEFANVRGPLGLQGMRELGQAVKYGVLRVLERNPAFVLG